jgi:hypothetical protein
MQVNRPSTPPAAQQHYVDTATDNSTTSSEKYTHPHPKNESLKKAPDKITRDTSEPSLWSIPRSFKTPERIERFRKRMAEKDAEQPLTSSEVLLEAMAAVELGSAASLADQESRGGPNAPVKGSDQWSQLREKYAEKAAFQAKNASQAENAIQD